MSLCTLPKSYRLIFILMKLTEGSLGNTSVDIRLNRVHIPRFCFPTLCFSCMGLHSCLNVNPRLVAHLILIQQCGGCDPLISDLTVLAGDPHGGHKSSQLNFPPDSYSVPEDWNSQGQFFYCRLLGNQSGFELLENTQLSAITKNFRGLPM